MDNNFKSKSSARQQYVVRSMDKFIKWSIERHGHLKWKNLVNQQDYYNIKVYETRKD